MTPIQFQLTNPKTGETVQITEEDIHVGVAGDSMVSFETPMGKSRELLLNTVELKEVKTEVSE